MLYFGLPSLQVWLLLLVFSIYTVRSQVKLLFVVLTQHVRAGAEYLAAEY